MIKEKWQKLMAFLGISKVESSAEGIFVKEEDMDKFATMHTNLETAVEANKVAIKNSEKLTADLAAANEQINALNAEKATLTTKITELEKTPAAAATVVEKKDDTQSSSSATVVERVPTKAEKDRDALAK